MSHPNPIHRDALGNDPRISWSFDEWFSKFEFSPDTVTSLFEEAMPGQADLLLKHLCMLAWLHAQGRSRFDDVPKKPKDPESPIIP